MLKNRNIPFGYQIKNGEYAINETEATVVRAVFEKYIGGLSLRDIAEMLTLQGVLYNVNSPIWNKQMVVRILENRRYLGEKAFPRLITDETFKRATSEKKSRRSYNFARSTPEGLKHRVFCESCGAPLQRLRTYDGYGNRWNCVCKAAAGIPHQLLEQRIVKGLNRVVANPSLAAAPSVKQQPHSMAVMRLSNEMNRELDNRVPNREKVRELIFQCAAEKYKVCGEGLSEHHARRLQELFRKHALLDAFDPELFESAVEGVFISPDTAVRLKLYSGADITIGGIEK